MSSSPLQCHKLPSPADDKEARKNDETAEFLHCYREEFATKFFSNKMRIKELMEQHRDQRKRQRALSPKGRINNRRGRG